ncbi:MAG: DUF2442 domain-containing protein [Bacteroidota bacterium]
MKIVTDYNSTYRTKSVVVKSATYLGDFKIEILFSDATKQVVNFKPFLLNALHPSIKKYQDESLFQNFQIAAGNLNWNDYDLIFPIDDLYVGEI